MVRPQQQAGAALVAIDGLERREAGVADFDRCPTVERSVPADDAVMDPVIVAVGLAIDEDADAVVLRRADVEPRQIQDCRV